MKIKWKKVCALALTGILCTGITGSLDYIHANALDTGVTQIPGTVHTESELDGSFLSVSGFAAAGVHDRSQYKEGDPEYAVVTNEYEFLQAISNARYGGVKVIEIRSDLYLGWNELSQDAKDTFGDFIEQYTGSDTESATPVANPVLIESGVSALTIDDVDGLTIFSKTGNTIKHAEVKLNPDSKDIVLRNLRFDEMWEWDDWRPSGFGSTGGKGTHKRTGWSFIKINGANNVWIDHCSFGIAFDGNVDIENGSSGITMSWCEYGDDNNEVGSMIYKTAMYMEQLYQESKKPVSTTSSFVIYGILRDNGLTVDQVMQYMSYHDKCHLSGAGDKDTWLVPVLGADGKYQYLDPVKQNWILTKPNTTKINANERIRLSLAYNHYTNIGQRLPLIRSGVGHLYNCYVDDMKFAEIAKIIDSDPKGTGQKINDQIDAQKGTAVLSTRCIDARDEASIGADTCVYYGSENPITGSENQLDDLTNINGDYKMYWTWNHALIVNSSTTKADDKNNTYVGSSWDNNGENMFTTDFKWRDKSTIGNWSWGQQGDSLPYEYQTFPLADVVDNTTKYSGAYKLDMSSNDWLKTSYTKDFVIKGVDTTTEVPVESIALDKQSATVFTDEYLQLDVLMAPLNTTLEEKDLTWTSSNPAIASVSNCGLVTPLSLGTTTITVKTPDGKTASCEVTVAQLPTAVTFLNVPSTIYVGDIYQFKADVLPGDLVDESVEWQSLWSRVNILDAEKGIVEAVEAGSDTITAIANLIPNRIGFKSKQNNKTISIVEPDVYVTGVALEQSKVRVATGSTSTLKANVLPVDATNKLLTYEVSDSSIATVDENGVITGVKEGTTTVTVKSINKGFTQTCEVTVFATNLTKGDMNGDSLADASDALVILKYIVGKQELTEQQLAAADVNSDQAVNVNDVLKILKDSVGK